MVLAWLVFPLVLTGLALGCGLLVSALCRERLAGSLLPAVGLAAISVVGLFLTLADAGAELAAPACVGLAISGLWLARSRWRALDGWALATAAGAFAVYSAPIVLSGEATFAGYVRLDDTATWLALTDRLMEHGRSLDGLAPSSYEAALAFNLADGYPVGALVPLGVAGSVVGEDLAWLIQPYMAWLGAALAITLYELARPLIAARPLRAAVAFVAAQPALLYGYYLWGGAKEVAAALLITALAALIGAAAREGFRPRTLIGPAIIAAALLGALSAGGLVWVLPAAAVGAAAATAAAGRATAAGRALLGGAVVAALTAPVWLAGGLLPPTSSPLTDPDARGNLISALEPTRMAGIWPAGDFRLDPVAPGAVAVLIALALVAAGAGIARAWRGREWGMLAYAGGVLGGGLVVWAFGSPWIAAKALAVAGPLVPLAAGVAAAGLLARGHAPAGIALVAAIAAGVIWSNALAYRDVNLAPREQLAELELIGPAIAGEGPTLMTEYQPYGVRHFLREAEPEGASELRRRPVPLLGGDLLPKGGYADTDRLRPAALLAYRTLVLRRSPSQSRPPADYRLTWAGEHYEVWQRRGPARPRLERLALGSGTVPVARPECARVRALAARAGRGRRLLAARRPAPTVVPLAPARHPRSWSVPGSRDLVVPRGAGEVATTVAIERPGRYEVWIGGTVRPRVELVVDGLTAGSVRHRVQSSGQYVSLGAAELDRGRHSVAVRFDGADLSPGDGGAPAAVGPLSIAPDGVEARIVEVPASRAGELCGREWDWIELGRADG